MTRRKEGSWTRSLLPPAARCRGRSCSLKLLISSQDRYKVTKISTEMIKILAKKMHGQVIQTIDGGVQGMFRTRDHLR